MLLASLAWIDVCRHPSRGPARVLAASALAVPLACVASLLLSLALNGVVGLSGMR